MKGIEVDIRPVRKDRLVGQAARCSRFDEKVYDRVATISLVRLFLRHPMVRIIYFNGENVRKACGGSRVKYWPDHDDHLHIAIWERR